MEVHSFQRKTIFSRNYKSQGLYLYLKQRRKETDTRTGNDSLIWYSWDMRSILRLSSKRGELSLSECSCLAGLLIVMESFHVPCCSWGAPFCKWISTGSLIAERLMDSPEACVSEFVLIYSCLHKCPRRKLLSGAAYSDVQLNVIPHWTGLNSRCAKAPLTLEFVLSVKHSEKSKIVPNSFPRHLWMTPVENDRSLILAKHFLEALCCSVFYLGSF